MNFTIKQSNQNPIFKKLKSFSYPLFDENKAKKQFYSKKRQLER